MVALLAGCGTETTPGDNPGDNPVEVLRAHTRELAARPEKAATQVRVRHILIAFEGTGTGAARTKDAAEQLTAELLQRLRAGEDFEALMREHSDDPGPGVYTMTTGASSPPAVFGRTEMVPAFGNVGWRLDVGEIGVAPYDPRNSQFGWHIIQRVD